MWNIDSLVLLRRALIPFGLHHVFYMPFWQTAVGGTMEVAGQMSYRVVRTSFLHSLQMHLNVTHFSADATRYFSGEFIFMIFGLPGAALGNVSYSKTGKEKSRLEVFYSQQHLLLC